MIRVLRALEAAGPVSVAALAEQLNVSRRTVFRDLESLRKAGFRIDFDHSRRIYRMHRKESVVQNLPSARDLTELLMQAAATSLPQTNEQRRRAARAAKTLAESLPVERMRACIAMQDSVSHAKRHEGAEDARRKIELVVSALGSNSCVLVVAIAPHKLDREGSWLTRPLQIVLDGERWLIEGIVHPCGRSLRADMAKVEIESTDDNPPLAVSSYEQPPEAGIEIF